VLATLGTMTLCGVWHGAAWTFVAWGIMHGAGMVVVWAWQRLRRPLPLPLAWALTTLFVIAGWVLFRSASFGSAAGMLGSMAGLNGLGGGLKAAPLLAVAGIVCLLLPPNHAIMAQARPSRLVAAASALATVACILIVGQDAPTNFIYFQF
jgi:D-alanyl-lipoteichoic acid acyltransferase DltB (MBOAT superfamily)